MHKAVAHLTDNSIVYTQLLYALGNQKLHLTYFDCDIHFTVVIWNQTYNISKVCLYVTQ